MHTSNQVYVFRETIKLVYLVGKTTLDEMALDEMASFPTSTIIDDVLDIR